MDYVRGRAEQEKKPNFPDPNCTHEKTSLFSTCGGSRWEDVCLLHNEANLVQSGDRTEKIDARYIFFCQIICETKKYLPTSKLILA